MKVNLPDYVGNVSKTATILSNDPNNPEQIVRIEGIIKAVIYVKPSRILFSGTAGRLSEADVDLVAETAPFHITGTETNLGGSIDYSLQTVEEGTHYRLRVFNKARSGSYGGFIMLKTDLPRKPDVIIHVMGFIEGEITARPQTVMIGKLSAGQPERFGKVFVTRDQNKPFEITRLTYDKDLMTVSQEKLENQKGFVLHIQPRLESVRAGSSRKSDLKIETNAGHNEKVNVLVIIFNNSARPEGQRK